MELFMIRHGETDYSREKKYCGSTDVPLNTNGISQIERLQKIMAGYTPDMVYCSTRRRTQQTAELLFPGKAVIHTGCLDELCFGAWEGLTYREILECYGEHYSKWLQDPTIFNPPAGESFKHLWTRVKGFLKEICNSENEDKKIVCVAHSGPLKIAVSQLLYKGKNDFWSIETKLAGINCFLFENGTLTSYFLGGLCEK